MHHDIELNIAILFFSEMFSYDISQMSTHSLLLQNWVLITSHHIYNVSDNASCWSACVYLLYCSIWFPVGIANLRLIPLEMDSYYYDCRPFDEASTESNLFFRRICWWTQPDLPKRSPEYIKVLFDQVRFPSNKATLSQTPNSNLPHVTNLIMNKMSYQLVLNECYDERCRCHYGSYGKRWQILSSL